MKGKPGLSGGDLCEHIAALLQHHAMCAREGHTARASEIQAELRTVARVLVDLFASEERSARHERVGGAAEALDEAICRYMRLRETSD